MSIDFVGCCSWQIVAVLRFHAHKSRIPFQLFLILAGSVHALGRYQDPILHVTVTLLQNAGCSMDQAAGGRQGWWPTNGCLPLHGSPTAPDDGECVHFLAYGCRRWHVTVLNAVHVLLLVTFSFSKSDSLMAVCYKGSCRERVYHRRCTCKRDGDGFYFSFLT